MWFTFFRFRSRRWIHHLRKLICCWFLCRLIRALVCCINIFTSILIIPLAATVIITKQGSYICFFVLCNGLFACLSFSANFVPPAFMKCATSSRFTIFNTGMGTAFLYTCISKFFGKAANITLTNITA